MTKTIYVEAFQAVHGMQIQKVLNQPLLRQHAEYPQWMVEHEANEFGVTYSDEHGDVIACVGADDAMPEIELGVVWLLLSERAQDYGMQIYRGARKLIPLMHKRYGILEALVEEDNVVNRRFVEALGFEAQMVLDGAGPYGEDMVMYWHWREDE